MADIFFTSDTHYHHKNIVTGVTNWPEEVRERSCRKFSTLEEMDDLLVSNINKRVKHKDTLYHLGDWSFGDFENVLAFRKKINCRNVHLILGNHDQHIEKNRNGIRGIFSSVQPYLEINLHGEHIVMCHYPFKTWHRSHHGSWHLHGHCHGNLSEDKIWLSGITDNPTSRKTMDVGVDTHWDFSPYSFDELKFIIDSREIEKVDNH